MSVLPPANWPARPPVDGAGGADGGAMTPLDIRPVILCGGGGTRLWPLSSASRPKQFHALIDEHSLLQTTALRGLAASGRAPVVVASADHVDLVRRQLADVGLVPACIIAEPCGRNTAPGIALAAHWLRREADDALMWVLPSDHRIGDETSLFIAAREAACAAGQGYLATFGVPPMLPHTGYGYIRRGTTVAGFSGLYHVAGFREKPDAETAARYVASGDYYWNSGMFMFAAARYLAELAQHEEAVGDAVERAFAGSSESEDVFRPASGFAECPAISIDYAVMERTRDAVVVPMSADWSDVGTWGSLWECSAKDPNGNISDSTAIFLDSSNCLVRSTTMVAVLGLSNVVVVQSDAGLLVCDRRNSEAVKRIGALLAETGSPSSPGPDLSPSHALGQQPAPRRAKPDSSALVAQEPRNA